ncbi:hypothetical protein BpHYR1_020179 [Brachionus plicatilis]|uniref:Uncharacterized protein n=1 Tax=Brachionus plicatilis TaxID=10195 RepID=A0A3M7QPI6_BRAPC|nr:hypothetical protein BpHYR1_020179 [Brachionus plicatilis]
MSHKKRRLRRGTKKRVMQLIQTSMWPHPVTISKSCTSLWCVEAAGTLWLHMSDFDISILLSTKNVT